MRNIMEMGHELYEKVNEDNLLYQEEFFKALTKEIHEEIQKGTDLSPYLSVKFNVLKRTYEIKLELSPAANFFDSRSSNGKG